MPIITTSDLNDDEFELHRRIAAISDWLQQVNQDIIPGLEPPDEVFAWFHESQQVVERDEEGRR